MPTAEFFLEDGLLIRCQQRFEIVLLIFIVWQQIDILLWCEVNPNFHAVFIQPIGSLDIGLLGSQADRRAFDSSHPAPSLG
jgi:hypothetical protein